MRQRPSLFNYGTKDLLDYKEFWCKEIDYTQDVTKHSNPIFTVEDYLPVLGADSPPVGLSFCAQLTEVKLDFHPGNTITLPAELSPPLGEQRFSLHFQICGTIGCPSDDQVDTIQPTPPPTYGEKGPTAPPPVNLHGNPNCFCLDVFAIGHVERIFVAGKESLLGKVDDVDIVEIKPDALEENLTCYLKTAVNVILREKLTIPIEKFFFSFSLPTTLFSPPTTISFSPTPDPPIPYNPAIEDDQLKVFMTMKVTP